MLFNDFKKVSYDPPCLEFFQTKKVSYHFVNLVLIFTRMIQFNFKLRHCLLNHEIFQNMSMYSIYNS